MPVAAVEVALVARRLQLLVQVVQAALGVVVEALHFHLQPLLLERLTQAAVAVVGRQTFLLQRLAQQAAPASSFCATPFLSRLSLKFIRLLASSSRRLA